MQQCGTSPQRPTQTTSTTCIPLGLGVKVFRLRPQCQCQRLRPAIGDRNAHLHPAWDLVMAKDSDPQQAARRMHKERHTHHPIMELRRMLALATSSEALCEL